jgi:putative phosphoribosyl transferase
VALIFRNRVEAGRRLAERLQHLSGRDVVVLGLPRGGVPVAYEVAQALHAPLDVIVVRKLGVPFQPELAMGAIGEEGVRLVDERMLTMAGVNGKRLAAVEARERVELDRRARLFRGERERVPLEGKWAVIVDDGIATGSTARAAARVARALGAGHVVVATPVAPVEVFERLREDADEVVVVDTPEPFYAIGQFYVDFSQTPDAEVTALLEKAAGDVPNEDGRSFDEEVVVAAGETSLEGHLHVPENASGIVVFAHGSGSSRHSPRNRMVADVLNRARIGTLLFDLLTTEEEADRTNVFDIDLLAERLLAATRWLMGSGRTAGPVGYFGASTGAAAALAAAADLGKDIAAVVSRGGRPDLAGSRLAEVVAPTLLIVGSRDRTVLDLNRLAQTELRCESRLEVVPGATHLFEEPGALDMVARLALDWFAAHFVPSGSTTPISP